MQKSKPIIFTGDRPKGIIDGLITQTRRVIEPQPLKYMPEATVTTGYWPFVYPTKHGSDIWKHILCPYGKVGDLLWVREDYKYLIQGDMVITYYKFSNNEDSVIYTPLGCLDEKIQKKLAKGKQGVWKSKLLMFKFMNRIWREITGIRVERVQDIDYDDVIAEGYPIKESGIKAEYHWFKEDWDSINHKRGFDWSKNPFVWCISFKKIEK